MASGRVNSSTTAFRAGVKGNVMKRNGYAKADDFFEIKKARPLWS